MDIIQMLKAQNIQIKKQNEEILTGELEQYKVIQQAIRHYGNKHQVDKAIEEMAELIQVLMKHRIEFNRDNIIEEIADVEIMMQQLCLIFKCSDEVVNMRRQKIERLKRNIENESIQR